MFVSRHRRRPALFHPAGRKPFLCPLLGDERVWLLPSGQRPSAAKFRGAARQAPCLSPRPCRELRVNCRSNHRFPASEKGGTWATELSFVLELGFGSEVQARQAKRQGQQRTLQCGPGSLGSVATAWGLPSPWALQRPALCCAPSSAPHEAQEPSQQPRDEGLSLPHSSEETDWPSRSHSHMQWSASGWTSPHSAPPCFMPAAEQSSTTSQRHYGRVTGDDKLQPEGDSSTPSPDCFY